MKNNILITGGHGYIGGFIKGGKKYNGDINDFTELVNQCSEVNGIVHLAAVVGKDRCEQNHRKCIFSNILGLLNVLEVAKELRLWVIFASTYQVGEIHLYGLSKLIGEELCRLYKRDYKVNVVILRLPSIYGPNDKSYKFITSCIDHLRKNKEFSVDDKKLRFVYVKDIIKIIENEVKVLQGKKMFGKKHKLMDIKEGIKECLKLENK